jgi:hypothetical protein
MPSGVPGIAASVPTGKEVVTMDVAMTIEEFHALLTSERAENPLVEALRKLTAIEEPEDIAALAVESPIHWGDWNAV